jgi:signal peptidase I
MSLADAEAVDEMAHELLARGSTVTFVARGASMRPFLRDGDRVTLAPLRGRPRLGDVVLTRGASLGVVHRVVALRGGRVLTKGDALPRSDGWRSLGDVLGRVERVERAGRAVPLRRWLPLAASLARRVTPRPLVRLARAVRR